MAQFQKLFETLFLTLHGHNIDYQEQKLSTFLMRYQQFASHAHYRAVEPVSKMASQQEKAFRVLRSKMSRSVITVQREFRTGFKKTHHTRIMYFFNLYETHAGCNLFNFF
jgi:hypothetical protein